MPTFLDESGDAGVGPRSAPFFRLAAVWFERIEEAEACRRAIAELRRVLRVKAPERFEFKFSWTRPRHRTAFLEAVRPFPFRFVACSVDKRLAPPGHWTKDDIYRVAVEAVTRSLHEIYLIAEECKGAPLHERVLADRTDDPDYSRALRTGFLHLKSTRRAGASLVKSVKSGHSHADDLIQLADIVCGAVGDHLDGQSEEYKLLSGKQLEIIQVSKNAGRGRSEPPAS